MTPPSTRRRLCFFALAGLSFVVASVTFAEPASAAPTPRECATASEDALSLRSQEKLNAARERLLVCTDAACPAEIRQECARRLPDLMAALPSVVFDVKDAAGNDLSAVRISMDGTPLLDHVGGAAVSVDPGEHTFRFDRADGSTPLQQNFVIRDGEKNRQLAVSFPATEKPAEKAAAPSPSPSGSASRSLGGQRTWALVAGVAGIVGIGVGTGFGIAAASSWNGAKNDCGTGCAPTSPAQSEKNDASSQATLSTVGFVAGGVLIAGAAALWLTAPSGAHLHVGASASGQGAGIVATGTF